MPRILIVEDDLAGVGGVLAELVLDEEIGGLSVRHAQQRFGEHHQRQPLARREREFAQHVLDAAERGIRATGVGVPYAFAVSVFGGTAEYLALWFKSIQLESGFYWYTTCVIACTLLVCWFMRDTRKGSLIDAEARH